MRTHKRKNGSLPDRICSIAITLLGCAVAVLLVFHLRPKPGSVRWRTTIPRAIHGSPAGAVPLSGNVSVNTAGVDELTTLPGVGPALAEYIIEERQRNGRFYYPEDLLCVRGIGEKTLEKLLPYLNLD